MTPVIASAVATSQVVSRGYSQVVASVDEWLDSVNLEQHKALFVNASITETHQLIQLTDAKLIEMGVVTKGHRVRLLKAFDALDKHRETVLVEDALPGPISDGALDTSVFDFDEVRRFYGFDKAIARKLIGQFDSVARMDAIDAALATADATGLSRAAHSLKGGLAYLQAHAAIRRARRRTEARCIYQVAGCIRERGGWCGRSRAGLC